MSSQFVGKCFCIITGGSSGFGQAIAQLMVKEKGLLSNAVAGSKILLLSRNIEGMEKTKALILEHGHSLDRFSIDFLSADLSNTAATETAVNNFLTNKQAGFDHFILFNNAGVLGNISGGAVTNPHPMQDYQKWFNVNMVSPIFLINRFCKHFSDAKCTVVQTSSFAAIQPSIYMSNYSPAKAGMDMFMQCLTLDHPEITTLSYSPGPMNTPMGVSLANNHGSQKVKDAWEDMRIKETDVKPLDSAQKLLNILQNGEFKSGDFIDVMGRTKASF